MIQVKGLLVDLDAVAPRFRGIRARATHVNWHFLFSFVLIVKVIKIQFLEKLDGSIDSIFCCRQTIRQIDTVGS